MKYVSIGLIALAASAGPALALDGPGRALVVSNAVQFTANALLTSGTTGGTIQRTFIPPYIGTVRVTFETRSSDGSSAFVTVQTTHLSNCSKTVNSQTFVPVTCDIRVAPGRPASVSVGANNGYFVELRNVKVSYNVVDFDGKPIEIPFLDD